MVNDFEVIHMGGRTYNPVLGRFMQADPFIQSPTNLQSYNRYSYVLNNPMSYTDPSGYFFKKLGNLIKDNWRTLASIAVGYVTFGLGTGAWSLAEIGKLGLGMAAGWGAAAGAASGFVSTGSLRGALSGAISGAAFGAIGASGLGGVESFAVSGLAGGILSDVQGGKFGHGFVSAGIGVMAGGRFGQNPYAQVIGAAVVGGTISAVTGGKFANGAVGAAFAAALRAEWGGKALHNGGDSDPIPDMGLNSKSVLPLELKDGKLSGIIEWSCSGGADICQEIIRHFNNLTSENSDVLAVQHKLTSGDGNARISIRPCCYGGEWDPSSSLMTIDQGSISVAGFLQRAAMHELTHAYGVAHSDNSTKNYMSYYNMGAGKNPADVSFKLSPVQKDVIRHYNKSDSWW
jgi:RHS repeat-associated protein